MELGNTILILPSEELARMQLMELAFRNGEIVEIRGNRNGIFGAWVKLEGDPYLDEEEWFIPVESISL